MALRACEQYVKFVSMLLEEMNEAHKPSVIYEDNQGYIFLVKNMEVGMHTKHIDIRHHFLKVMVEDKYIDIKYIWSEEIPASITTKNTSKADFVKHTNRIT